jgi:hypothetical protein
MPLPAAAAAAPPILPAPQQQQQQQQQPARVAEGDLQQAERHLSRGISLLVPLLK